MFSGVPNAALVKRVKNVHDDDIHGICVVNEEYLVSSSKDTSVKLFKLDEKVHMEAEISRQNFQGGKLYEHWGTAIDIFNDADAPVADASVTVGYRNGYLLCKSIFNKDVYTEKTFEPPQDTLNKPSGKPYKVRKQYKVRNENRITGIRHLGPETGYDYSALIGMPQQFHHYDFDKNVVLGSYKFAKPEWVYGFCQVDPAHVAIIHGSCLSLFNFKINPDLNKSSWNLRESLLTEEKTGTKQRAFISSVFSMEKKMPYARLAISLFGGITKVIDVVTKKTIHKTKEHEGRVWQTVPFSPNEYISCADDKTIKIWDLRVGHNSVSTYGNHPGRVSSIAIIKDFLFVAGTCAEDPHQDPDKGQFYFYDIRKSSTAQSSSSSTSALPCKEKDEKKPSPDDIDKDSPIQLTLRQQSFRSLTSDDGVPEKGNGQFYSYDMHKNGLTQPPISQRSLSIPAIIELRKEKGNKGKLYPYGIDKVSSTQLHRGSALTLKEGSTSVEKSDALEEDLGLSALRINLGVARTKRTC